MKILDLFSGVGGFSLAARWAGFETVAFCEIDPFCQRVLRKHWPEVPVHDDIKTLDGSQYCGAVDIVCGGFPCQPYSVAGERKGAGDDRALWPHMFRVIRAARPAWVVAENVPGLKSMGLDRVLSDLESAGYTCRTTIIPALAVGAPHQRDRLWIIAHSDSIGEQIQVAGRLPAFPQPDSISGQGPAAYTQSLGCDTGRLSVGNVAEYTGAESCAAGHPNGQRCQKCHAPAQPGWAGQLARQSDPERVCGCETQPGILRVADGLPAWMDGSGLYPVKPTIPKNQKVLHQNNRIKSMGNSIHPEIAYRHFQYIKWATYAAITV